MALSKHNPTHLTTWQKLNNHFKAIQSLNMNDWFKDHPNRAKEFQIRWQDFFIDYSKHRITAKTKDLLIELAEQSDLEKAIRQQFSGELINETENRAVLHTALRRTDKPKEVRFSLAQIKEISQAVISGQWKGYSGKKITDIVNIGIGGSDLGPKMVVDALTYYRNALNLHFVSNIDGDPIADIKKKLNPETTLFIIVSKSFSTQETLTNAHIFKAWFLKHAVRQNMTQHFIGITANNHKAEEFGISANHILPVWDWVGGRFSLWSAVGLSIACAIGYENFEALLNGAQAMDTHFKTASFEDNIPVILGLLSIWYNNFFKTQTEAVIPYSDYLTQLIPFLQQSFMESNGKSVSRAGKKIDYQTGNIIWGAVGTNAQHAFFQLLHQGTKLVPCDFIGFKRPLHQNLNSHHKLMANFFAQTEALLKGKNKQKVEKELALESIDRRKKLLPFKIFEGNKPTTTILIDKLTPKSLGSLIALYEHKIFVQGVIWNIYSYDQYGVELGKQLASHIEKVMDQKQTFDDFDNSTKRLLEEYLSH